MENEKKIENAYYLARKKVAKHRTEACDLLDTISEDTLERIENERKIPTPDEVLEMARCFNEPNLRNHYCANQCPLGQEYVPSIEICELSQTILQMLAALNTIECEKDRLVEIAADGQIDDSEIKDFIQIEEDLIKISMTAEALQLWSEKMLNSGKINIERYNELKK